jgi:hypothetical protein
MSLDPVKKDLLNLLGQSQPALNDPTKPYATSNVLLGDLMDQLFQNREYTVEATYDFDADGGAQGTIVLNKAFPAGAIVTRLVTRAETALAGAGASVAIEIGASVLKAATAYDDASYTGLKFQTLANPVLVAAAGNLEWVISGADLTDGKMRIMVSYILP